MLNRLYSCSPVILQNVACSLKGLLNNVQRLGGNFEKFYEELNQSQWWTKQEIEKYQLNQIRKLIDYSIENIPYYRELFASLDLSSKDINCLEDMKKIPILTKEDVRQNYDALLNPNYTGKIIDQHTSGSTGKALHFVLSREAIQYRWAVWFRHRARFGVSPFDSYATFTGQVVVPITQKSPPFWRENYVSRQTIFTMHHISKDKVPSIVSRLNKGNFTYYAGYPSILYSLAILISDLELKILKPPKIIFTGAEQLLDYQREEISRVFGCLVTDQYGFSEGCGNASRCEKDVFHEDFEYGYLETVNSVLNSDGSKTGEVLATGFTNLAMPFIRYKIGDTATFANVECSCGRSSKVITKIEGRNEDFILTPEGNKILRFDYIFKDSLNIKEAQIIQEKIGEIVVRIVPRSDFHKEDELLIRENIATKISPSLRTSFEYVDSIERERTGKFRAVKSYL